MRIKVGIDLVLSTVPVWVAGIRCAADHGGSYGLLCGSERSMEFSYCRRWYQVFQRFNKRAIAAGGNVCMMGSMFAG